MKSRGTKKSHFLNTSFKHVKNTQWFNEILEKYSPQQGKPIVFLPYAKVITGKFEGKRYSGSMSHQYMSCITRDPRLTKKVVSELLTVEPYECESTIGIEVCQT
ncbi:MAG: hypothetical protein ACFE95_22710 [Candidatus Hodarchaeota archaeon]